MRVAYTLNGLIGGLSGKNSSRTNEDDMPYIIDYVYSFFDKNILPYNTSVDFFIFSWQTENELDFKRTFAPKKSKYEEQFTFKVPPHLPENNSRVQAHYSRWYGFNEVMKLKSEYEKENDFTYDLVVNARMDTLWNQPIRFELMDRSKVHIASSINVPYGYGSGVKENEIAEHIFAMNSYNMDNFAKMYNHLDEYTSPGQCPQWNHISSHFLSVWHLNKLGLLNDETIELTFPTDNAVGYGNIDNPDKTAYTLLRYRDLNIEKIKGEIE